MNNDSRDLELFRFKWNSHMAVEMLRTVWFHLTLLYELRSIIGVPSEHLVIRFWLAKVHLEIKCGSPLQEDKKWKANCMTHCMTTKTTLCYFRITVIKINASGVYFSLIVLIVSHILCQVSWICKSGVLHTSFHSFLSCPFIAPLTFSSLTTFKLKVRTKSQQMSTGQVHTLCGCATIVYTRRMLYHGKSCNKFM